MPLLGSQSFSKKKRIVSIIDGSTRFALAIRSKDESLRPASDATWLRVSKCEFNFS